MLEELQSVIDKLRFYVITFGICCAVMAIAIVYIGVYWSGVSFTENPIGFVLGVICVVLSALLALMVQPSLHRVFIYRNRFNDLQFKFSNESKKFREAFGGCGSYYGVWKIFFMKDVTGLYDVFDENPKTEYWNFLARKKQKPKDPKLAELDYQLGELLLIKQVTDNIFLTRRIKKAIGSCTMPAAAKEALLGVVKLQINESCKATVCQPPVIKSKFERRKAEFEEETRGHSLSEEVEELFLKAIYKEDSALVSMAHSLFKKEQRAKLAKLARSAKSVRA